LRDRNQGPSYGNNNFSTIKIALRVKIALFFSNGILYFYNYSLIAAIKNNNNGVIQGQFKIIKDQLKEKII